MVITDTPGVPFEKCVLDIVRPLTVSSEGNKYILIFQDHLIKFNKAMSTNNQKEFWNNSKRICYKNHFGIRGISKNPYKPCLYSDYGKTIYKMNYD